MGPNEVLNIIEDILSGKQVKVNIGEKLVVLKICNRNLKYLKIINNFANIILISIFFIICMILLGGDIWSSLALTYGCGFILIIIYFFIKKSINKINYVKFKLKV